MEPLHIKAYPTKKSEVVAIKSFLKEMKIKFELTEKDITSYSQDFIDKIKQGEQDLKEGKGLILSIDDLEELCK